MKKKLFAVIISSLVLLITVNYFIFNTFDYKLQRSITKKPKDIFLVLDKSRSMGFDMEGNEENIPEKESRLYLLKKASLKFIDEYKGKSDVRIGLVAYSKEVDEFIELRKMNDSEHVDNLTDKIDKLDVSYNTNAGDGMRNAYLELKENSNNSYMIIMSDGSQMLSLQKMVDLS